MNTLTAKQFGDSCEMLVLSRVTLAGTPTAKMPDGWPGYDLIAQRPGNNAPLRISVKARHADCNNGNPYFAFDADGSFDWLACVAVSPDGGARCFLLPYERAVAVAIRGNGELGCRIRARALYGDLTRYENNFAFAAN
jgi:hypothetical protein